MPNYITPDVKDLINKMLQPNPVKRITMSEIKEHPWFLKDLPLYLKQTALSVQISANNKVDEDIVNKLYQVSTST